MTSVKRCASNFCAVVGSDKSDNGSAQVTVQPEGAQAARGLSRRLSSSSSNEHDWP